MRVHGHGEIIIFLLSFSIFATDLQSFRTSGIGIVMKMIIWYHCACAWIHTHPDVVLSSCLQRKRDENAPELPTMHGV